MEHKMNLNNDAFNLIKSGTKTIEMRLNDEKRSALKEGDLIQFTNRTTLENIVVKVVRLYKFSNFEELYKYFDKISLGYNKSDVATPNDMEKYYSKEEQNKYGVVGIEIRVITKRERILVANENSGNFKIKLVLASSSKQRQDILDMIGLKYEVLTSDIDENSNAKEPNKYVEELSLNKAKSVSEKIDDKAIIVAADTIIYFNNKKYEKPKSKIEAYNNLKELAGNKNFAYTGVTIIDLYKNKTLTFSEKVGVYFKNITDEEINWYVNNESKIFKCCGYAPIGKASIFIDKIEGDYNTLLGISPSSLFEKMKELGYSISDFEFKKDKSQNKYNIN